jgi:hypothetical protein
MGASKGGPDSVRPIVLLFCFFFCVLCLRVCLCFVVREGDLVTVGQCRPLSKCIRFNVVKVVPQLIALRKKRFQPL